jgi:hypothetical protein
MLNVTYKPLKLSVVAPIMLSVAFYQYYAECPHAESRGAKLL